MSDFSRWLLFRTWHRGDGGKKSVSFTDRAQSDRGGGIKKRLGPKVG